MGTTPRPVIRKMAMLVPGQSYLRGIQWPDEGPAELYHRVVARLACPDYRVDAVAVRICTPAGRASGSSALYTRR
jgi:hypothetical protein